jgi:hypothetical protein
MLSLTHVSGILAMQQPLVACIAAQHIKKPLTLRDFGAKKKRLG